MSCFVCGFVVTPCWFINYRYGCLADYGVAFVGSGTGNTVTVLCCAEGGVGVARGGAG